MDDTTRSKFFLEPMGEVHRLQNEDNHLLGIVEVQVGEDKFIRGKDEIHRK